jgi:methionyl-tRNA formyltransferase
MIETGFPIDYVFGLDEKYSASVSGYAPIHKMAQEHGLPAKAFHKISDPENLEIIRKVNPDYIFVIGLSQLIPKSMIDLAKVGVVGFHPTPLPKMRGRAALVWQILLGIRETKCSLFFIDEGMDSGDILGQQEYFIEDTDYVSDVSQKLNIALKPLTNKVLHGLMDGSLKPQKQNEEEATYLLVRRPEDGHIQWNESASNIHRLIRAVSKPFPGAFGLYDGEHTVIIWRAECLPNNKYIGIPGQICNITDNYFDIVTNDGLIRVTEWENKDNVKLIIGHKLK